ncbi:S/F1C fimbrial usher SfaF/FocD [Escherichia coli]
MFSGDGGQLLSDKSLTGSAGGGNNRMKFNILPLAFFIGIIVSPARAELYFNPRFLSDDPDAVADLSAFTQGQELPPGVYRVDIYLNDTYISTRDVQFQMSQDGKQLAPCLSPEHMSAMGVNRYAVPGMERLPADTCTSLNSMIQGATFRFDVGQQRLYLTVPQIYMSNQARGYIAPEYWDNGITAALLNYDFSGNRVRDSYGGTSDYAYLNLKTGLNIGSWRLRDNTSWSYSAGKGYSQNNWQHINTWLERDIVPLRSRLTMGDSYTQGDIFDGVNFRGIQLASDDNMVPDSQRGYAPTIHGISRGTSRISIRQNGYEIYQSTLPPGPFEINDIYPTGSGGDLQVTLQEADGSVQRFNVPWSSVPVLQREGHLKYALSAGEFRSGGHQQDNPRFAEGTLKYGLPAGWTVYGGAWIAERYRAFNLGVGKNMGWLGAVSLDATRANARLPDESRHDGQSYRFLYNKSLTETGTNIQLIGYRYSTRGYFSFADTAWKKMSGYSVLTQDGVIQIQPKYTDYYNLAYNKRGRVQVSISQQTGESSTLYLSGSHQSYWGTDRTDRQLNAGFNSSVNDISWSLNYSLSRNAWQHETDRILSFDVSIPFSHWMRSDSTSAWRNASARYSQTLEAHGQAASTAGLYGTLLEDNNLGYSIQSGYTRGGYEGSSKTGYASLNYRGGYGNASAGYSHSGGYRQLYYGLSGGILAHANGLTLSQPLGDTLILVRAPGASDTRIENQTGVSTDWRGYAVLPYATDYRENRVALDTNTLADNVDIENTVVSVVPTHGAVVRADYKTRVGVKVLMTLMRNGKAVPFGSVVTVRNGGSSIAGENGQVYLSGMPLSGQVSVKWGSQTTDQCTADYKLPKESAGQILSHVTVSCR